VRAVTEAALAGLYERYGHLVLWRCQRLLSRGSDAEDTMHDVFLRLHSVAAPREGQSTLVWLYRITTNACYDRLRRLQHSHPQLALAPEPATEDDGDRRALLSMVLRQVDPTTCQMGLLHHVDGLPQEEIAVECGSSRRTVGKKLEAFDQQFREQWRKAGGE